MYGVVNNMSQKQHPPMIPLKPYIPEMTDNIESAKELLKIMKLRRSVREFSNRPVSQELIETLIEIAGTAPSGANKQPWRFIAIQNPQIKHQIRVAAEVEETEFYNHRAPQKWLTDLEPLGTNENKEFLEIAPWLIVIFKLIKTDDGNQVYYPDESVGLATGLLLTAAHLAGLVTLTHTPSPMKFLTKILKRPANERPYLLIPIGYPAEKCMVPDISKKALNDFMVVL